MCVGSWTIGIIVGIPWWLEWWELFQEGYCMEGNVHKTIVANFFFRWYRIYEVVWCLIMCWTIIFMRLNVVTTHRGQGAILMWEMEFIWPIKASTHYSGDRYIITTKNYLTRWIEDTLTWYFSTNTVVRFIFDNIVTRFGYLHSLTRNQG